ncbi:hypothetical protein C8Q78DRAFT_642365 [Trametes maxima]|nr:hypothetical protein C8Q78DRAFT_642365 [Trametes maxima]
MRPIGELHVVPRCVLPPLLRSEAYHHPAHEQTLRACDRRPMQLRDTTLLLCLRSVFPARPENHSVPPFPTPTEQILLTVPRHVPLAGSGRVVLTLWTNGPRSP